MHPHASGQRPGVRAMTFVRAESLEDRRSAAFVHAVESGALTVPPDERRILFLGARAGDVLRVAPQARWLCEQGFKPHADALRRQGVETGTPEIDELFPLVLALPTRQRDETRAMLARALHHCTDDGIVVAAMSNAEGARSGEMDLRTLVGASVHNLSKHKCRVFWVRRSQAEIDAAVHSRWLALDAIRPIGDGRFVSRPGLFAWDRIDAASALLASNLPATLSGRVADLGAGYGYLAAHVIEHCPNVAAIDLYEADARALEPARINVARAGRDIPVGLHWHDVTAGLPLRYDAIVSNPPFHIDRADRPDLGRAFIRAAADALVPHGEFWLVANQHLPYESTLIERFGHVQTVVEHAGFKVVNAREPRR